MGTNTFPRGKAVRAWMKEQSVDFATAASGNYKETLIYSHTLEEKEPFEIDSILGLSLNNGRDATKPAPGLPTMAGQIVVPVDYVHFGIWLKKIFGAAAVTNTDADYTHVFKSGGEVIPHDTMELKHQLAAGTRYFQYIGLFGNKLSFEASRKAGFQQATIDCLGRSEVKNSSSGAGTPTSIGDRMPIPASKGVFKMDDVIAADIISVSPSYDNAAKVQEDLGDKYPTGVMLVGESLWSGGIQLRFRSTTLYDQAQSGDPFAAEILFEDADNLSLSFTSPITRLAKAGLPVPGPGSIQQAFDFRAEQDDSNPMLTVTLKNQITAY